MPVTLTQAQLSAAMRLGDSAEENAEATRLLAYATEAIDRHLGDAYEDTPGAVVNEAAIRLSAYLFDQPTASRGMAHADALRNSGAASMLLPYRVHRAGSTAQAAIAADQEEEDDDIDQVARDAAAAAMAAAQVAQTAAAANAAAILAGGLHQIASVTAMVAVADTWLATTLPVPATAIGGASVLMPSGDESEIFLFRPSQFSGMAVAGDMLGAEVGRFVFDTAADGRVLFASSETGEHVITFWEWR